MLHEPGIQPADSPSAAEPDAPGRAPHATVAATIREFATALIAAETLDGKLAPPAAGLADDAPFPAVRVAAPRRPAGLEIVAGRRARTPPVEGMADPAQRRRILHAFANHELQAAELFAWALLAFPEAPSAFRRGLLGILADEQRHCRAYIARIEALGGRFGDLPVSGHFWRKAASIETPLEFVCAMGLTFENANLDFAAEHAAAAERAGDAATAAALRMVHDDEIRHVAFAYEWLREWKPGDVSAWDAYCAAARPPHGPSRARGARYDAASRRAAGIDDDFVARLGATSPDRPGGAPR